MKTYVIFYLDKVLYGGSIENFDPDKDSHTVHTPGFGPVVLKTADLIHLNPHLTEV